MTSFQALIFKPEAAVPEWITLQQENVVSQLIPLIGAPALIAQAISSTLTLYASVTQNAIGDTASVNRCLGAVCELNMYGPVILTSSEPFMTGKPYEHILDCKYTDVTQEDLDALRATVALDIANKQAFAAYNEPNL